PRVLLERTALLAQGEWNLVARPQISGLDPLLVPDVSPEAIGLLAAIITEYLHEVIRGQAHLPSVAELQPIDPGARGRHPGSSHVTGGDFVASFEVRDAPDGFAQD